MKRHLNFFGPNIGTLIIFKPLRLLSHYLGSGFKDTGFLIFADFRANRVKSNGGCRNKTNELPSLPPLIVRNNAINENVITKLPSSSRGPHMVHSPVV